MTVKPSNQKTGGSRVTKPGAERGKPAGRLSVPVPENQGNREKILGTALRLFTQYGVDATPTSRISKEAGVSTGTLFYYFPDKDRLVGALYLSIKKELAAAVRYNDDPSLPTRGRIGQGMRGYVAWGVQNPLKVRFLDQCYNYPGIGEDVQEQVHDEFSWMAGLMESAVREGIVPDLPVEFQMVMLSRVLNGILALIESGSSGMTPDDIIENGLAMLWKK